MTRNDSDSSILSTTVSGSSDELSDGYDEKDSTEVDSKIDADSSETKIYFTVPDDEKERAKALGARWDAAAQRWYAPNETVADKLQAMMLGAGAGAGAGAGGKGQAKKRPLLGKFQHGKCMEETFQVYLKNPHLL